MATTVDIPPEMLLRVAAIGGNRWEYFHLGDDMYADSKAREFLRHFSLVCKKWQGPGQVKLWEEVHFDGRGKMDGPALFAGSDGTRRGIKTRELSIRTRASEEVASTVAASRGVRKLILEHMGCMDATFLGYAVLADLKELDLVSVNFNDPQLLLNPHFLLTHLRIRFNLSFPARILSLLLQPSVAYAAYYFILQGPTPSNLDNNDSGVVAALTTHAPNLRKLALFYDGERPELHPILANCVQVTDLTFNLEYYGALRIFGGKLRKLKLFCVYLGEEEVETEVFGTEGGPESLKLLKELVFDTRYFGDEEDEEHFQSIRNDLRAACQKRRIKLVEETKSIGTGSFWGGVFD